VSGASHPSALPESAEWNSEHATMLRGVSEQALARWLEVADAVWFAGHRDRSVGSASAPEPPGQDSLRLPVDMPVPANRRGIEDVWRLDALLAPGGLGPGFRYWPGVGRPGELADVSRVLPKAQGDVPLRVRQALLPEGPVRACPVPTRAPYSLARHPGTGRGGMAEQRVVDGMWMPFLRPARASAFDLVLLVDDAPTMRIWEDTTTRPGPGRATQRCLLGRAHGPGERFAQRHRDLQRPAGPAAADPAELLDGRGDCVLLGVTDGLAHGLASPGADHLLGWLAHSGPTAIVHPLPPHLRRRSSLYPYQAVLEASGFGATDDSVPVPVLSLKPGSLAAWADLVAGERGVRRAMLVVLAGTLTKGALAPGLHLTLPPRRQDRVRRFLTLATPLARRFATQLAAIPFDFDPVEQLRRRTMPETGPDHLAEILKGG
jgi:hypothetical protein